MHALQDSSTAQLLLNNYSQSLDMFPHLLFFRPKSSIHLRLARQHHCVDLFVHIFAFSHCFGRGVCAYVVPLYYTLQGEVAQTVSKALLSQLHILAAGGTGEHHHQRWALLAASPWICPISRRPGHGWRRRVGTSNQEEKPVMSRGTQKMSSNINIAY